MARATLSVRPFVMTLKEMYTGKPVAGSLNFARPEPLTMNQPVGPTVPGDQSINALPPIGPVI